MKLVRLLLLLAVSHIDAVSAHSGAFLKIGKYSGNWTWPRLEHQFKTYIKKFLSPNIVILGRHLYEADVSESCTEAIFKTAMDIQKLEGWAVKMLDATAKIPAGILDGATMDFGAYDECLAIRVTSTNSTQEIFRGKYCMVGYHNPLLTPPSHHEYEKRYGKPPKWISDILFKAGGFLKNIALWFGTCVPSSCTAQDIKRIATAVSRPLGFNIRMSGCQVDEPRAWQTREKAAIAVLSSLASIALIGTLVDIATRCFKKSSTFKSSFARESILLRLFKAFSLYGNTERWLQSSGGMLSFFHGVRFFSATWIILGHTYFFIDKWKYLKYRHLAGITEQFNRHLAAAVIENFTIPVTSFFFMSGFLMTFTNWPKLVRSNGRMNIISALTHRFWRMTPALMLTIAILLVIPVIGSGPLWDSTFDPEIKICLKYWWRNLLFISNLWDSESICMLHTWYLAALMQFHIIAMLLLLISYRCQALGIILGVVILLASCSITAYRVIVNNFPMPAPGMTKDLDVIRHYNSDVYTKPYAHISTYLIGMLLGYIVMKYRQTKPQKICSIVGWIASVICGLSSVYGIYGPSDAVWLRAAYISLHRIGWSLSLAWLTYICATGAGGIIGRILSWKPLNPLGQLSYLAYLLHPLVLMYRNASLKERVYYGHTELVFEFLSNTVVSFFLAYICYVWIEMSFSMLEMLIFYKSKKHLKNGTINDNGHITAIGIRPCREQVAC